MYSTNTKKSFPVYRIVFLLCVVGLGIYILYANKGGNEEVNQEFTLLPPSPLDSAYEIEGETVLLTQGKGSGERATVEIIENPIYGDINSDGEDDVSILLSRTLDGSTEKYITVAVRYSGGYLGLNALTLSPLPIETVAIKDELVIVTHRESDSYVYEYFVLRGATLERVGLEEREEMLRGIYTLRDDALYIALCSGVEYVVDPGSQALAALRAIYLERERTSMLKEGGVYMLFAGIIGSPKGVDSQNIGTSTEAVSESGSGVYISSILTTPQNGSCPIEPKYEEQKQESASTTPLTETS